MRLQLLSVTNYCFLLNNKYYCYTYTITFTTDDDTYMNVHILNQKSDVTVVQSDLKIRHIAYKIPLQLPFLSHKGNANALLGQLLYSKC